MARQGYPSQEAERFQIRMTDGLRDRLKKAAAANKRSANSEIIARLEASFETTAALESEIARLLAGYVEAEVQRRLKAIASQIGGA